MKRYFLFEYSEYYPKGGWLDFKSSSESLKGAMSMFNPLSFNGYALGNILDSKTGSVVAIYCEYLEYGNYKKGWIESDHEYFNEVLNK